MGRAKQEGLENEDRLAAITGIAVEKKAIVLDENTDETSSNEDPDADKLTYAASFQAWADGQISGTAEEIFEAVQTVLDC